MHAGGGARSLLTLSREASALVLKACAHLAITPFNFVLGMFCWQLARSCANSDITIGSPISERPDPRLERVIGLFLNYVTIRHRVDETQSVAAFLGAVSDSSGAAFRHGDLPFDTLVDELELQRVPGRQPLTAINFTFLKTPAATARLPDLSVTPVATPSVHARFDLSLLAREDHGELHLEVEYRQDLYEPARIEALLQRLATALQWAARHPNSRLLEHRAPTPEARGEPASTGVMHRLFEAVAARQPDSIALWFEGTCLTYGELDRRANRFAAWLSAGGVRSGDRVALAIPRGPHLAIAILGALKAGAAYVPLDLAYPRARLVAMLDVCGAARLVVAASETAAELARAGAATLDLAAFLTHESTLPDTQPAVELDAASPAYVVFTSGSTGVPKGIEMPHGTIVNLAVWHARHRPMSVGMLQFSSPSFDVHAFELFAPWVQGKCALLVSEAVAGDAALVLQAVSAAGVDCAMLPAAVLEVWAQLFPRHREWYAGLRTLISTAEALHLSDSVLEMMRELPQCVLCDYYGPSETHVVTAKHYAGQSAAWRQQQSIGLPVGGITTYVLDRYLNHVSDDAVGELYLGGCGLAYGYIGAVGQTAGRFLPDPFSDSAGARMYRTGDLARRLPNGEIRYLGRADTQLKIRGYRIEAAEVETVVANHPLISQAVVAAHGAHSAARQLVAYVIARDMPAHGWGALATEVREHVRARLPAYMVPASVVVLESYPLTPNGKVDRNALPAPPAPADEHVEPGTAIEKEVARIWTGLLNVERVGLTDNFFELGGNSVTAMLLVAQLREKFGVAMPLGSVFRAQTLAELALEAAGKIALSPAPIEAHEQRPQQAQAPLSFEQERLWIIEQLEPLGPAYNVPAALLLQGVLDVEALSSSIRLVVQRHEALRTGFQLVNGAPVQVIGQQVSAGLKVLDWRERDSAERDDALRRLLAEEVARPFDIGAGPLFRATLVRLSETSHALVMCAHHMVCDGWSIGIFTQELARSYGDLVRGDAPALPALHAQYVDYAVWQRSAAQSAIMERQLEYWVRQLGDAPAELSLPTDRLRPKRASHKGGTHAFQIPEDLHRQLQELASSGGATLFVLLLCCWQILLAKLSGERDLVVGTPVAHRLEHRFQKLIGLFVGTVALRAQLRGERPFVEQMRLTRDLVVEAFEHQDVPFEKIVQRLQPNRDLARQPIFQVMFVFHNTPAERLQLPNLDVSALTLDWNTAKFDLTLAITPSPDGLTASIEYASDLFNSDTVAGFADRFLRLLRQVAGDGVTRLAELCVLSDDERHQLLRGWNQTARPYPADCNVFELFERQSHAAPAAVAISTPDGQLSYGALEQRAIAAAVVLQDAGVNAGDAVVVSLPRSTELVVAQLAILRCGAAYVPLDAQLPMDRLRSLVESCRARHVIVASPPFDGAELPDGITWITTDELLRERASARPRAAARVFGDSVAYIMYTSGSTGAANGVAVPHRAISRLVLNSTYAPIGAADHVAYCSHPGFDATTYEVWGALLNGATVVVVPQEIVLDPPRFASYLIEQRVSVLWLTVGLFNQYLTALREVFPRLRHLLVGGDVVDPAAVRRVLNEGGPANLVNGYGPTESTTFAICHRIDELPADAVCVPIGRPIENTQVYLLDQDLQPVPVGASGEIYIGGDGIATGYVGRPLLTAERFLPDPFGAIPGARLYRTGDLARRRSDGVIEFLGRRDRQVKIRGFRIEPGEVEAQLRRCAGVNDALVIAHEAAGRGRQLLAYVTTENDALDADALRAALRKALPDYMVPADVVLLNAWPLTPNGKIDRKALPAPTRIGAADSAAPHGEIETALAAIWSELLQVSQIGRDDNFFDLGGHSLLAVQLVARVGETLGRAVSVRDQFEHPTLHSFAKHVFGSGRLEIERIARASREHPIPLSWAQMRLWFLDQLEGTGAAYHIPCAVRLAGVLDVEALQGALDAVVARHEVLRTVFVEEHGTPRQIVNAATDFELELEDLSAVAAEEQTACVRSRAASQVAKPFDLARGPLIRGKLLTLAEREHVLLLTMHHIVSDGWSLAVLLRELAALYAAQCAGTPHSLPELPLQYADYALWQRRVLDTQLRDEQVRYWTEMLAGAPALLELPTDRPRPPRQTYQGASVSLTLGHELTRGLREFARRHSVTLYMALYAAWAVTLSKLSGQSDIVIGAPVANRRRVELESLIGLFVNTLALRVQVANETDVGALLRLVKERVLGAYEHQDVPFEQIVEALQPRRSLGHNPVFQVLLVLQNLATARIALPGLDLIPQDLPIHAAQFDLIISLQEQADELTGAVIYASDLFDAVTIERWIEHFRIALGSMIADPRMRIVDLSIATPRERKLFADVNATEARHFEGCLHEPFVRQALAAPDRIAVLDSRRAMTYGELLARSSALAQRLIERGVGPEHSVALVLRRGWEQVVATLGVLLAGGTYLPIDPQWPAARRQHVMNLAAPTCAVTTAALDAQLEWPEHVQRVLIAQDAPRDAVADVPPCRQSPEDLAYVIFTSGSTGEPKGVMIEHRAALNTVLHVNRLLQIGDADRVLAVSELGFDLSVYDIFGTLAAGAAIVIPEASLARDPSHWRELMRRHRVSLWNSVPQLMGMLVDAIEADSDAQLSDLRVVLLSGDWIPVSLPQRIVEKAPSARVISLGGATEGAIWSIWYPLDQPVDPSSESIPYGYPLPNQQMHVLDSELQPTPIGAKGEIYIGGAGVARGYLRREELTVERFIPDRFSTSPTARIYKTGDQGRRLRDGAIQFLGRNDQQVKIRGFRVELGEVEAHLRRQEGVTEVIVTAQRDASGNQQLVAYFTCDPERAPGPEALRAQLATSLPDYMIPSAFVPLERLPLSANGKLDRAALPAIEHGLVRKEGYQPPQTPGEVALAEIWQQLLKVERVGRGDDFFDLGGHSLLVMQMRERLRQRGLNADVRAVFTKSTLAEFAQSIRVAPRDTPLATPSPIPLGCAHIVPEMLSLVELRAPEIEAIVRTVPGGAANVQDIYPLSPLQEGILFHHLLSERADAYVLPTLIELPSPDAAQALATALDAMIERYDILRTAVAWEHLRRPVQVVYRRAPLRVERVELAHADARTTLERMMTPQALRMAVTQAPLLRMFVASDDNTSVCYVLLLVHHLVCDHVSLDILLREVGEHVRGNVPATRPALQFRDFIANGLSSAAADRAAAYFRERLADITEPVAPFGLTARDVDGMDVDESRRTIAPRLAARLRGAARHAKVTLATVVHVAVALVISRASGRADVVFGSVFSGRVRSSEDMEGIVGPFINTLPIRIQLSNVSAREVVAATHQELTRLLEHEHASLAEAMKCSGVRSDQPLFTGLLNFRHSARGAETTEGGARFLAGRERTNFPFALTIDDFGDDLTVTVQVMSTVSAQQVGRYVEQALESLADALEHAPESPALTLEVIPDDELDWLRGTYPVATTAVAEHATLARAFERQVRATPDATAATCGDQSISYGELNARANKLARYLQRKGVAGSDIVAIFLERGLDAIVAILAVLKSGASYLPIDPTHPEERVQFMVRDSGAPVVISGGSLAQAFGTSCPVIDLDEVASTISTQAQHDLDLPGSGGDLAYLIYTSGSTGQPKGVMVEHAQVLRLFSATRHWFAFGPHDVWSVFHSLAFDFSVWEIWGALLHGGRLVIVPQWVARSPDAFWELVRAERVTVLNQTPSAFNQLASIACNRSPGGPAHALRFVIFGGEAMDASLLRPWAARFGTAAPKLINMYGITETTVHTTYYAVTDEDIARGGGLVVGRAIPDLEIYLLDPCGRLAPRGAIGEIHVAGAGVARGYLNRPQLQAERFVADPIHPQRERHVYRSGDLGRWRTDGMLEYHGRNDQQVKIRGFRIELGEIEQALRAQPPVRDAVALTVPDAIGGARLVAYIVAEGSGLDLSQLREQLQTLLPEYMLPSPIVVLDSLPLTANGKVDRRALPAVGREAPSDTDFEAPRGAAESMLADAWKDLLQVDRVSRNDHFFELGGHSLLATRLVARLRSQSIELSVRAVFERPLLRELAQSIEAQQRNARFPRIRRSNDGRSAPASLSQRRLWILCQLEQANRAYNLPMVLRIEGALRTDLVRTAFERLHLRHEGLRTRFEILEGRVCQRVGTNAVDLELIDARAWTEERMRAAVDAIISKPFLLDRDALFRVRLLQHGEDVNTLVIVAHHIITDGWSNALLLRDFSLLYREAAELPTSELPPLPVQYADFARWQEEPAVQEECSRQLEFWKRELAGLAPLIELPTDVPRGPDLSFVGATLRFDIATGVCARLRWMADAHGTTPFVVFSTALAIVLGRFGGISDVPLGTIVANRQREELENVVGFFTNTVVLRHRLDEQTTVARYLAAATRSFHDAYEHQDVPFDRVVDALCPTRPNNAAPLVQVMVVLQNADAAAGAGMRIEGLHAQPQPWTSRFSKFDLTISLQPGELGGMIAYAEYRTDLFNESTIASWMQCYCDLLAALPEHQDTLLCDLPPLVAARAARQRAPSIEELLALSSDDLEAAFQSLPPEQIDELLKRMDPENLQR